MYCSNCGSKLEVDVNFCPNCGKNLVNNDITKSKNNTVNINDSNNYFNERVSKPEQKSGYLYVAIFVPIIIIILLFQKIIIISTAWSSTSFSMIDILALVKNIMGNVSYFNSGGSDLVNIVAGAYIVFFAITIILNTVFCFKIVSSFNESASVGKRAMGFSWMFILVLQISIIAIGSYLSNQTGGISGAVGSLSLSPIAYIIGALALISHIWLIRKIDEYQLKHSIKSDTKESEEDSHIKITESQEKMRNSTVAVDVLLSKGESQNQEDFCYHCGSNINGKVKICNSCGKALSE